MHRYNTVAMLSPYRTPVEFRVGYGCALSQRRRNAVTMPLRQVSGQLEVVDKGAPFVYFDLGDGKSATCNPISEPDLANALIDTLTDEGKKNVVWNLGGPDAGLSMAQQGELVADVLGKDEAKLLGVPIGIFDFIINGLQVHPEVMADELRSGEATRGASRSGLALISALTFALKLTCLCCRARPTCSSLRSWRMPPSLVGSAGIMQSRTC